MDTSRGAAVTRAALFALAAAMAVACKPAPPPEQGQGAIAEIPGRAFEASGVAHVRGTNGILFVDDGYTGEVYHLQLDAQGAPVGTPAAVALGADVTDMEGITYDGSSFIVVGSQSKRAGFDGDGLVRFSFDTVTRRVGNVEVVRGLKAWLADNVAELRGTAERVGDEVLNIEAIAWDPDNRRLLLGLRAPVVDGHALVIPIRLADSSAGFTRENLRADGPAIRLDLGGAGIRSLEHDATSGDFVVITGASLDNEALDFRVVGWDGATGSAVNQDTAYAKRLKPEGVTSATLGGRQVQVLVFDTGRLHVRALP